MATNPVIQDRIEVWPLPGGPAPVPRSRSALLEIEEAVTGCPSQPHAAIARILALRVTDAALLQNLHCNGSPEGYTRHLVYTGVGFTILALVWMPGQMSPIHGHRSWCALAVRQGSLVETCFTLEQETSRLTLDVCRQLRPGMVSHSDGDDAHYHRVANLGVETAVSIHVYGVAFDQLGHGLNRIWDDEL